MDGLRDGVDHPPKDFLDCGKTCVAFAEFLDAVWLLAKRVICVVWTEYVVNIMKEVSSASPTHCFGTLFKCDKVVNVHVNVVDAAPDIS